MKDRRLYGRFTHDFPENQKILPLSDGAFRCLVEATLWSCRTGTDGFLARRLALAKWSLETLQELCCNDPDNPSLIERDEGWYIHDYCDHQATKSEIQAAQERNRIAGRKGGLAKAKRRAKQPASEVLSETLPTKAKDKDKEPRSTNVLRGGAQRGTRLPDSWQPAPDVVAHMRDDHPQINLSIELKKFIDYWTAKTGQTATKCDWNATYRNWIRRAAEQQQSANGNGRPVHKLRAWAELAAQVRAEENAAIANQPRKEIEH